MILVPIPSIDAGMCGGWEEAFKGCAGLIDVEIGSKIKSIAATVHRCPFRCLATCLSV